jgi:hypothetical protein
VRSLQIWTLLEFGVETFVSFAGELGEKDTGKDEEMGEVDSSWKSDLFLPNVFGVCISTFFFGILTPWLEDGEDSKGAEELSLGDERGEVLEGTEEDNCF